MTFQEKFNGIIKVSEDWFRIGNVSIFVDIVSTSIGIIRIGSMPDISKLLRKYRIKENMVIVPDWYVSQGGDNRTGEEFCFWSSSSFHNYSRIFVGKKSNIDKLYRNLDMVFSYYFDSSMTRVIKKRWLNKLFIRAELKNEAVYNKGNVEIKFEDEKIIIIDNNRIKYESKQVFYESDMFIEKILSLVPRYKTSSNSMEITVVGNGNGCIGTASSFILKLGDHMLWIDPCAQPAFSLGKVGIHWDSVSHILITHNHEDHILGFTACLKRAIDKRKKIKLITAPSIYEILLRQFNTLFHDIEKYIEFISLTPYNSITLGDSKIEARWNHHIIPYGTLGIKLTRKGSCFGFSGDTKYDEKIIALLKRKELEPKWFESCDVVFHEVDFESYKTVHTNYKELLKFKKKINAKLFVYHADSNKVRGGLNMALEGRKYILNNKKLEVK
jgi:ribonuclease BN (tRNA processing enzyme)